MKNLYKKIISIVLSFSILGMSFFVQPQKAEAGIDLGKIVSGVVVSYATCYALTWAASMIAVGIDILAVPTGSSGGKTISSTELVKDCGLDAAANQIKTQLISGILKSTTEWVKGGYEGKPAFITNPDQFLNEATDRWVAEVIENNEYTKVLCDGFKTPLKFAINLNFYKKNDDLNVPTCTMSDIEKNIDNALGDLKYFYTGGSLDAGSYWSSFIRTNTTTGGNAYESYLQVSDDLKAKIGSENEKKLNDINRNGGFMSIERCDDENDGTYAGNASNRICSQQLTSCLATAGNDSDKQASCNASAERCIQNSIGKKNCEYVTPGKVISDEVTSVLGMERENLQMADEFDELIAVIITQLMSKVFDSNQGLSGINRSGDNSDYESSTVRDISVEKASMLKQYSPRAYDIQLKIYQSLLDAISPSYSNFDPIYIAKLEKEYWQGKKDIDLGTEKRIGRYWSAAGHSTSISSNWSVAFVSYLTSGDVKGEYSEDGKIKNVNSNKYIKGEAQVKEGSIICNLKDTKNTFCGIVMSVAGKNASILGKIGNTLVQRDILLGTDGGLLDRENMAIFTPPVKDIGSKYDNKFYNNLYGSNYERVISNSPIKKDMFKDSILKWIEFKERYSGNGQTTLFWADGFQNIEVDDEKTQTIVKNDDGAITDIIDTTKKKKYLKHNMNFQYLPESVVNEVIDALSLNSLSVGNIEHIKKLRDDTIRDREEAFNVSEKIKKVTKIEDLWNINGNNAKADLPKAYKIYQQFKADLGKSMLGTPDTTPRGKAGYSGGLASLAAMINRASTAPWRWTTLAEKEQEDKVPDGPSKKNPKHWHIHIQHDQPFTLSSLSDVVVTKEEVSQFNITDIKLSYDPVRDITDLNSGLYDGDNYDYKDLR